jgi:hypothetical protein
VQQPWRCPVEIEMVPDLRVCTECLRPHMGPRCRCQPIPMRCREVKPAKTVRPPAASDLRGFQLVAISMLCVAKALAVSLVLYRLVG